MLVRVRRLIFEMLERRSMLAADAESLDGFDALGTVGFDAGEAVGGDPTAAFVAFLGEERIEPEIAGCWMEPPEAWCVVPPTAVGCPELPEVALVEPLSTFSVACSTADGSGPTVVLSGPSESGDTEVVDATVFEPEAMRGSPVAVSVAAATRATVTAGSADVARLFAAYAAGLGQSAADHLVAATIGGRRGTRR